MIIHKCNKIKPSCYYCFYNCRVGWFLLYEVFWFLNVHQGIIKHFGTQYLTIQQASLNYHQLHLVEASKKIRSTGSI